MLWAPMAKKKFENMFTGFDKAHDKHLTTQTDGQTPHDSIWA